MEDSYYGTMQTVHKTPDSSVYFLVDVIGHWEGDENAEIITLRPVKFAEYYVYFEDGHIIKAEGNPNEVPAAQFIRRRVVQAQEHTEEPAQQPTQ